MARDFERASSEYIHASIGALDHTGSGGLTYAVIVRPESLVNQTFIALSNSTPAFQQRFGSESGGGLTYQKNADIVAAGGSVMIVANQWTILAVRKAGGTAAPIFSACVMSTGVWTHTTAGTSLGNSGSPGGTGIVQIGRNNATNHFDGRMALAGAWKRALSQAEIESLVGGLRAWLAQKPDGLWPLNQGAVGTTVVDWTGNGANQTAISGTTISADHPLRWRWGGTVRRVQRTVGATTYNQSVAGTLTSAGGLVRHVAKSPSGALTTAGGLVKQVTHALTGTLTTAGGIVKQVARALTGTLTSGGTLANVKVAVLTLAGTLTSAGGLTKQAARTLAGTLTSSGALANIKVAVLALTGGLSTAGAMTRQTARTLAGTLTSAGGLTRLASRTLTGTLSASGAVAKQASRAFAGTLTTAGGLTKHVARALAGTLTSAGGLANEAVLQRAYFIGAVLATIRDAGAAALADAINGAASMTTAERGAARLTDRAGGAASGTDRSGGAASGAGKPPE